MMYIVMFTLLIVLLVVALLNLLYISRQRSIALWEDHIIDRVHEAYKKIEEQNKKDNKK